MNSSLLTLTGPARPFILSSRCARGLCALLLLTSAQAEPAIWPPAAMKKLPADYLDRLHASLGAGTSRLDKLGNKTGEGILYVRAGQPSLLLGQKTKEINAFFESDAFTWQANPKFGFSLFTVSFMRLYGVANHRTGLFPTVLTDTAVANFEKGMWNVAKANSKLSEAKRGVWEMEGSENHHLSSKSCDLLAAQNLRKIPAYADQKYDDGSTLEEQYQVRLAYFLDWFDARAKRGQFVEAGSPSYQGDSIAALANLRDFSEDPTLRKKADMYLDLVYAAMAEETLLTTRGGPKSRVKVGHEYDGGMAGDRSYNLLFNSPGRTYEPLGENVLTTSDYYPAPAIVALARDTKTRGIYSLTKRWPGPVADGGAKGNEDPDGVLWRTLDPEKSVRRYGFCTPSYVLGSAGLDPSWLNDASMGNRWQGVVFDGSPLSRIGFEVLPAKREEWHGFNPYFTVQDRNVFITQQWAPMPPNPTSARPAHLRMYFSATLDSVEEEGGWVFVREGGSFAALRVEGPSAWSPAWQHGDTVAKDKAFLVVQDEKSPVILLVNQASDYAGDFAKFKTAVLAQPVVQRDGEFQFATITFCGLAKPPSIDGKPFNLAPARGYDSPFIRSAWGSGLIYIRKGNDTEILDFRDPKDPKKTVGAPVTAEFPAGVGSEQPIVFSAAK